MQVRKRRKAMIKWFLAIMSLCACSWAGVGTVNHIVILIKENRSLDTYFGQFPGVTGGPITSYACLPTYGDDGGCPSGNCVGGNNHGAPCSQQSTCTGGGKCVGAMAVQLGNPYLGDYNCGHAHLNALQSWDNGAMDGFNRGCGASTDWAKQYGSLCQSGVNVGLYCTSNANCPGSTCANTIPHYWGYATNYGLADHMFASAMAPTQPMHMYLFAGTASEIRENEDGLIPGGPGVGGVYGGGWDLDAAHVGVCNGGSQTGQLCGSDTGVSCTGGTCIIDQPTGVCASQGQPALFGSGTSCTKNDDCQTGQSGIISITKGSTAVAGTGTSFSASWVGSILYVTGGASATVASVADSTHLTLVAGYVGPTNEKASFSMGLQFCANGNFYGHNVGSGIQSYGMALDLLGSPGAPGTKTGYGAYPGICQQYDKQTQAYNTVSPPVACFNVCPPGPLPNECAVQSTVSDPACGSGSYSCYPGWSYDGSAAGPPAAMMAGARGAIGYNGTTMGDLIAANCSSYCPSSTWTFYVPQTEYRRNPLEYIPHHRYGPDWTNHLKSDTQFDKDAAGNGGNCTLPGVSWLETSLGNEHPPHLVGTGEAWSADKINAVLNGPCYNTTVIIVVWDDWGGFADHIAPTFDSQEWARGIRVPLLCIGIFCKNQITTTVFTFGSILKMIENLLLSGTRLPGSLEDSTANDLGTNCVQNGTTCTGHGGIGMLDLTLHPRPIGSLQADDLGKAAVTH